VEYKAMSEWFDINQWDHCIEMARPGIVFEIRNADGQSMFSPCTKQVPEAPFDWKSSPLKFRAVLEPAPEHSSPIPKPEE
jgi:hypothetical protein